MKIIATAFLFITIAFGETAYAAVGCDLNDPDRDVKRLFPGSTGYKTMYLSLDKRGEKALSQIEERLGDRYTGLFETVDVPYTVYEIFNGKEKIGYIHGVNQKGKFGGIQVFLSLDMNGVIKNLYYQKLTAREAAALRAKDFGMQFAGLTLKDFYRYNVQSGKVSGGGVVNIKNPAPGADHDFKATLRAVKKNLILMDEFIYNNKYLPFLRGGGEK